MEDQDQKKFRLMILAVAGLLLLGCAGGWLWYSNKNQSSEYEELTVITTHSTAPTKILASPGVTATTTTTTKEIVATNVSPTPTMAPPLKPVAPGAAPPVAIPATAPITTPVTSTTAPVILPKPTVAPNAVSPPVTLPIAAMPAGVTATVQAPTPTPGKFPATKREQAALEAKQKAGRTNPMTPVFEGGTFPRFSAHGQTETLPTEAKGIVPAPPKSKNKAKPGINALAVASAAKQRLVPPPPPTVMPSLAGNPGGSLPPEAGLPIMQLPPPPDKPSMAGHLRLSAIIGNRAVIQVPYELRFQHRWPAQLMLGPGEQFESIRVVSVDPDSVTIDEDGERSIKTLAAIK
ncbi:MAG: hypothetical protein K2W82_01835 [Candidatus Obscuribacterales bacterium]|nr:hypothetical protein [Candidatus Obscuribacterales bacterium]